MGRDGMGWYGMGWVSSRDANSDPGCFSLGLSDSDHDCFSLELAESRLLAYYRQHAPKESQIWQPPEQASHLSVLSVGAQCCLRFSAALGVSEKLGCLGKWQPGLGCLGKWQPAVDAGLSPTKLCLE